MWPTPTKKAAEVEVFVQPWLLQAIAKTRKRYPAQA
jgi:hypothetical protein